MFIRGLIFLLLIGDIDLLIDKGNCPNVRSEVSVLTTMRRKRHLTFPDGSAFVMTMSLVKAFMTHAPAGWNIVCEIDVLFPLPDANFTNSHFRRILHRRQRREFWDRTKSALDIHNLNGHACVLRSICEAKTYLAAPGQSLVHDILRTIFTVPHDEEEFKEELQGPYSELQDPQFCEKIADCPFSLIDFIMVFNNNKR